MTPETSLGFEVIEWAEDVVGVRLYPWQKWLLVHALELLPDGMFRFRTVVVLVARQNGKSTLSQLLALYCLYVLGVKLVVGTAQDLDLAEEIWDGVVEIIEDTPELAPALAKVVKVNGKKSLELTSKERYKVKAANRRAGRGLSGDLILLDELREHQHWAAWSALTKTTMARPNAQIWCMSNAGDSTSVVLRHLRVQGHRVLGDPDGIVEKAALSGADPDDLAESEDFEEVEDDALGLFEWSALPGCSRRDRDGWAMANPSLGHGGITERTIASFLSDPEWEFRTEVLCQWADGVLAGVFPPGAWDARADPGVTVPDGRRVFAVDVAPDGASAAVAGCAVAVDGSTVAQFDHARGFGWVVDRVVALVDTFGQHGPVILTGRGAAALKDALEAAGVKTLVMTAGDMLAACSQFYEAVVGAPGDDDRPATEPTFYYRDPSGSLTAAVNGASRKESPDGWTWNKRGPVDISPLVAVTGARWALARVPDDYDVLASIW